MKNKTEEDGIKAIIFLQKFVGKIEPYEKAERGWRSMTESEKLTTMEFYKLLSKKRDDKK